MLKLLALCALSSAAADTSYYRIDSATCADISLGSFVGICPTSLVVSKGGLKAGTCATLGYTAKGADLKQKAGPCGTLDFNTYTKPAALALEAAPATTTLITFDGASGTGSHAFRAVSDPVMGGLSESTFHVDKNNSVGVFSGEVKIVPSLKAPGFCNMQADKETFPDISSHTHLMLKVRTSTPDYKGWKVDFGPADHSGSFFFSSYKADFAINGTGWQVVSIPFTSFSSKWSAYTGEPTTKCADDKDVCPNAKRLAGIKNFEITAEGAAGKFELEVEKVWAGNADTGDAPFTVTDASELVLVEAATSCPAVSPLADLNFTEFIRATWFVQKQQVTGYQKPSDLFCVTATYNDEGKKTVGGLGSKAISVYNYQNEDKVNGKPGGAITGDKGSIVLCARMKDHGTPSKLLVAPCFLPDFLAGDYWVVAAGKNANGYELDWAIVSGGQPTEKYADGCTTKKTGTNGSGFWFFTRARVASAETLQAMEAAAKGLGYTTSQLIDVPQAGCTYADELLMKP